jgi:hypothetical protein
MNIDINVQVPNKKATIGELAKVRVTIGGTILSAVLTKNSAGQMIIEPDTLSKHFEDKMYKWNQIGKALEASMLTVVVAMYNEEVNNV